MSTSGETHKVENWSEYNDALVDRGRLTVWISEEAIQDWKADREPQQGAQWIFTDRAIETCLQIKMVYGLGLRETEGFVESLFGLVGLEDLPVPDYTTLSKRQGDLDINLPTSSKTPPIHLVIDSTGLVIDSTGLEVYGEGEWTRRIHGKQKRRTWRKLHLGVDSDTGEITAVALTDNTSLGRLRSPVPLLEETLSDGSEAEDSEAERSETGLGRVGADGAYDTFDVYRYLRRLRGDQRPWGHPGNSAAEKRQDQKARELGKHGNSGGPPLPRDEAIRYIRQHGRNKHGRNKWKRTHGYHRRSNTIGGACLRPPSIGSRLSVQRTDGTVRGGAHLGKRTDGSPTESEDGESDDPAGHAENMHRKHAKRFPDRAISEVPPLRTSAIFVQQSPL